MQGLPQGQAHARAHSTYQNSHNIGGLNTACPWQKGYTNEIYYIPRSIEQDFESNLIQNQYVFKSKLLDQKYQKKQLPDNWMTEIEKQKSSRSML